MLGWLSSASVRGRFTDGIVPGGASLEGRARPERGVGIPLMIRKQMCLEYTGEKTSNFSLLRIQKVKLGGRGPVADGGQFRIHNKQDDWSIAFEFLGFDWSKNYRRKIAFLFTQPSWSKFRSVN